jgi:hypothetical protein
MLTGDLDRALERNIRAWREISPQQQSFKTEPRRRLDHGQLFLVR